MRSRQQTKGSACPCPHQIGENGRQLGALWKPCKSAVCETSGFNTPNRARGPVTLCYPQQVSKNVTHHQRRLRSQETVRGNSVVSLERRQGQPLPMPSSNLHPGRSLFRSDFSTLSWILHSWAIHTSV